MEQLRIIRSRYRLERPLQVGPLATTHLATDLDTDEPVVLKQLSLHPGADADETLARYKLLEREARILRNLQHPGIPRFIDTFHESESGRSSIWLVQEYREGRTLQDMVEDGWHGSAEDIANILKQVADVLGHLHTRVPPIVHRDVKPANIIVGPDESVSLLDLGAACTRVLENKHGSTIVGTPGYVPMEQFVGKAVPASDVYALGMVGVFLITHEQPLSLMREDGSVRYRHLATLEHPTLLSTIDRMIAPGVRDRLPDAGCVVDCLDGTDNATQSVSRPAHGRRFMDAVVATAAVLLLTIGSVVGYAVTRTSTDAHEPSTEPSALIDDDDDDDDDDSDVQQAFDSVISHDALLRVLRESMTGHETDEWIAADAVPATPPSVVDHCVVELVRMDNGDASKQAGADPDALDDAPDDALDDAPDDAPDDSISVTCAHATGTVDPIVVGPGRIRLVLDELPESVANPPTDSAMESASDAQGTAYWIVDATPDGLESLGFAVCPRDSTAASATMDDKNRLHLLCMDFERLAYHVTFEPKRGTSRLRGEFALDYDEQLTEVYSIEEMRLWLAVPRRGPAFAMYEAHNDDEDAETDAVRVQPIARGAKSFALFPEQLVERGDWVLFNDAGRVYALVWARHQGGNARELHKIEITSMGARLAGTMALPTRARGDDVFCHRLTTASTKAGLAIRSPNAYGDHMEQLTIRGGYAIPGPDTASSAHELCGDSDELFVKVGTKEIRLLLDTEAWGHALACRESSCVMTYREPEGIGIVPFSMF